MKFTFSSSRFKVQALPILTIVGKDTPRDFKKLHVTNAEFARNKNKDYFISLLHCLQKFCKSKNPINNLLTLKKLMQTVSKMKYLIQS